MKNIKPPLVSNRDVLKQIAAKNAVLGPTVPALRTAYVQYHRKKGRPAAITPVGLSKIESDALEKIYAGETKKYDASWIRLYRAAPKQPYCPLCGGPNPSQLEHYLPRAHYPEFTALSWNLVPTCGVCNPKRGHHAHAPGQFSPLIHPYYEGKLLSQPLFIATIKGPFEAVSFTAAANENQFSTKMVARLRHQISTCVDQDKFHRWLSRLWTEFHCDLSGLAGSAARAQVIRKFRISSATTGMNSWDTMFYRGLFNNKEAVDWLRTTKSSLQL